MLADVITADPSKLASRQHGNFPCCIISPAVVVDASSQLVDRGWRSGARDSNGSSLYSDRNCVRLLIAHRSAAARARPWKGDRHVCLHCCVPASGRNDTADRGRSEKQKPDSLRPQRRSTIRRQKISIPPPGFQNRRKLPSIAARWECIDRFASCSARSRKIFSQLCPKTGIEIEIQESE